MNYRIEISPLPQWRDARGEGVKKQIEKFYGFPVEKVWTRDVYTVAADISEKEAQKVASLLYNPVLQGWRVTAAKSENFQPLPECEFLVAVGFRPGVTDNVGRSAKSAVGDILGRRLGEDETVFSSTEYLFYGRDLTREQA
ncbi:MAG: phosphoribosylformylglycinamidine synthase, partial [Lentisphaeria bacterium]|nr:phosphoribosylformylglycinamidine synthase [Lentisphaeria bacterium]